MTHPLSDHLRLVPLDDLPVVPARLDESTWPRLCQTFSEACQVPLRYVPDGQTPPAAEARWSCEVPPSGSGRPGRLVLMPADPALPSRERAAQRLAQEIGEMAAGLHHLRASLWQREAELATAIPLVVRPDLDASQLAARLEAVLHGAAEAVGCQAAAMYLLDDATRQLKLRAHWGLSHDQFAAPPRSLRTAKADVEALAGHAVVLEEDGSCRRWQAPQPVAAAVCVPISTATVPLGTLWTFSHEPRDFTDAQVNLVEIMAGRLAVELEREILLRELGLSGKDTRTAEAIAWQKERLPSRSTALDAWQIAARPSSHTTLHGDHYDWQMVGDETLLLTLATAQQTGLSAALTAAALGGVSRTASTHTPGERLWQLHEALLHGSSGGQFASAFCGALHQRSNKICCVAGGHVDAFIIRPYGWEAIATARAEGLGAADFQTPQPSHHYLQPGDVLLVLSGRPRRRPRLSRADAIDARTFAETLLHHGDLPPEEQLPLLAALWDHEGTDWETPPAMLIARRRA